MPTSYEFDRAAALLDSAASDVRNLLAPSLHSLGPITLNGGQLGLVVEVTLNESAAAISTCVDHLIRMADLCRERAEVCRTYAGDLSRYRQERDLWLPEAEPRPVRPTRPAYWDG